MLDKIFSNSYNVDEKKKFLLDECGIIMTEAVNAEVESMCNYSDYVEPKSKVEGKKETEDIFANLALKLNELGRVDELFQANVDAEYRTKLLKEFSIAN